MKRDQIIEKVSQYYGKKVREFGPTARGVDWNSEESQTLRFEQLARVLPESGRYTVLDYGCGYGALVGFLEGRGGDFDYVGFDVSADMVRAAAAAWRGSSRRFTSSEDDLHTADYAVASGIFNVKLDTPEIEWEPYVLGALAAIDRLALRGFAFNMLTTYSDKERMRPDLYYADPCWYFAHCKQNFSRQVALLHDYGLYEFTVIVRK